MANVEVSIIEAVRAVEERLEEANRTADLKTLDAILADDFAYTGGGGGTQSREEWLPGLTSRRQSAEAKSQHAKTLQRAADHGRGTILLLTGLRVGEETEYQIEAHGDIAVANRRYTIQDADGTERCLRYVRVYKLQGSAWHLLSHRYIHAVD